MRWVVAAIEDMLTCRQVLCPVGGRRPWRWHLPRRSGSTTVTHWQLRVQRGDDGWRASTARQSGSFGECANCPSTGLAIQHRGSGEGRGSQARGDVKVRTMLNLLAQAVSDPVLGSGDEDPRCPGISRHQVSQQASQRAGQRQNFQSMIGHDLPQGRPCRRGVLKEILGYRNLPGVSAFTVLEMATRCKTLLITRDTGTGATAMRAAGRFR
jgi:hypothetical protein